MMIGLRLGVKRGHVNLASPVSQLFSRKRASSSSLSSLLSSPRPVTAGESRSLVGAESGCPSVNRGPTETGNINQAPSAVNQIPRSLFFPGVKTPEMPDIILTGSWLLYAAGRQGGCYRRPSGAVTFQTCSFIIFKSVREPPTTSRQQAGPTIVHTRNTFFRAANKTHRTRSSRCRARRS